MSSVYICGTGMTKFGELWEEDLASLGKQAATDALAEAGVTPQQVDSLLVANMGAQLTGGQAQLGAFFADILGISAPSMRIEGACASGGLAIQTAFQLIQAGVYKTVLVLGVEKMTDLATPDIGSMLGGAAHYADETIYGTSFPAVYAMMARAHMERYGTTREDLAAVAVKNHAAGALNPKAHFQKTITANDVLAASPVASPLGLFDCAPISDGAAAVVLCSQKGDNAQARIVGSQVAHDSMALHERADLCSLASTQKASQLAYAEAKITAQDISIAELHDCFTIAELMAYQDLGFGPNPTFPTNTSGGLKACGHPVGATGVKQLVELALQFSGQAGKRQITQPLKFGLAHNVAGSGATSVVTVVSHA